MRNILALIGAFTVSSCSGASAVACGHSDNTTTKIFDWNKTIEQFEGVDGKSISTQDFLNLIGKNLSTTDAGNKLYGDLISYTALSIVKTNQSIFKSQYDFAIAAVNAQINNYQSSLKAKYGRSWEGYWKKFLDDPAQGGDGVAGSGSVKKWTDVLLKSRATDIVKNYYVGDNYHDFIYYSSAEVKIWLNDMWNFDKGSGKMASYNGPYKAFMWIVAYAVEDKPSFTTDPIVALNAAFSGRKIAPPIINQVPQTVNNQKPNNDADPGNFIGDSSKSVNGLLSDQQLKIAKVWAQNQLPIWTRQIVFGFDSDKKPLADGNPITADDFSKKVDSINTTLQTIQNYGFDTALHTVDGGGQDKPTSDSSTGGDLGLNLKVNGSASIKASYQYYVYRYVLSQQGIGQTTSSVTPYNLPVITPEQPNQNINLTTLIKYTNRGIYNGSSVANHTSKYNDEGILPDPVTAASDGVKKTTQVFGGSGLATFIDEDGLHIVQTRGITYQPDYVGDNINTSILQYNRNVLNQGSASFADTLPLVNRVNGLADNSYLSYLQSVSLQQLSRSQVDPSFKLNDEVSNFASGSADIKATTWWDYLLYSDNNTAKINWNSMKQASELGTVLGSDIKDSNSSINSFIDALETWFLQTRTNRLSTLLGNSNTDAFGVAIDKANTALDNIKSTGTPPARMDSADIIKFINGLGKQTLWWYNKNEINT